MKKYLVFVIFYSLGCSKSTTPVPPPPAGSFVVTSVKINDKGANRMNDYFNVNLTPVIKISFTAPVSHSSLSSNVSFTKSSGGDIPVNISYSNKDSVVEIQPASALHYLSKYIFTISKGLQSNQQVVLTADNTDNIITEIDSV